MKITSLWITCDHGRRWRKKELIMTKKETLEFIKETLVNLPNSDETVAAIDFCEKELMVLERDKERNAERRAKKAAENAPLLETLGTLLSDKGITASEAATELGISTQKASSLLRALVAEGKANVEDVKIPKKGSCKAYTKAIAE